MPAVRKLRSVPTEPQADPPKDITALLRADILKRDWRRTHVTGDRGPELAMGQSRQRNRDGEAIVVRSQAWAG